jgi:hypothetical protein
MLCHQAYPHTSPNRFSSLLHSVWSFLTIFIVMTLLIGVAIVRYAQFCPGQWSAKGVTVMSDEIQAD